MNWEKKKELGFGKNMVNPLMQSLKETLIHEKAELERKLKNLKMLGVIAVDSKATVEELNKKLEEIIKL